MPKKIINILTSKILKFIYILIFFIFFYELYFVAILKHLEPFLLENHIRIIVFIFNLQKIFFYNIINFFYYNSIIEFILFLIFIEKFYLNFKILLLYKKSSLVLWLLWRVNSYMIATGIFTSDQNQ
jgi:hypothetical protein